MVSLCQKTTYPLKLEMLNWANDKYYLGIYEWHSHPVVAEDGGESLPDVHQLAHHCSWIEGLILLTREVLLIVKLVKKNTGIFQLPFSRKGLFDPTHSCLENSM